MRNVFLFALFFTLGCSVGPISIAQTKSEITRPPTESFVKVYRTLKIEKCVPKSRCKEGIYRSSGSGISLGMIGNSSIILTAGHVCRADLAPHVVKNVESFSYQMSVTNIKRKTMNAKIVKTTSKKELRDLCMLLVPNLNTKGVVISKKDPEIGDRVYAMSAPGGIFHAPAVPILEGIFSGVLSDRINSLATIPAIGGSSGSGVLNKDMELVGILFAAHINFNHATLISSYETTILFTYDAFQELKKITD